MKENDKIKELFKERFESFEAPVDPKVWSGIESSIGTTAPATGVSILSTKAIIGLVVGATAVATIGVVSYLNTPSNDVPSKEFTVINSQEEKVSNHFIDGSNPNENARAVVEVANKDKASEDVVQEQTTNRDETNVKQELTISPAIEKDTSITEAIPNETKQIQELPVQTSNNDTRTTVTTEVVSQAPATIDVSEQSRAQAYPSGGVAPLNVTFSSVGDVEEIKWKFDDGTESSELNPDHEFEEPGIYFVTMLAKLKDGSVVMDKAVVEVKEPVEADATIAAEASSIGTIGNYFTPNGDGENDEFTVKVKGIQSYSISIYAVNGQLVYKSNDPSKGWNGNDLSGNRVVDGTYYYMINAIGEDQKVYTPKGYLTVTGGY